MGKILVTGATGFTGNAVCRRLLADGENVVALVRDPSRASALTAAGAECRAADLTDANAVRRVFDGVDRVYHIAAAYRSEHADLTMFHAVNVEGTRYLLEAASESGVMRFVHCSTGGVQGEIEDPPASEDYRVKPGDHYQQSKLEGERLALEYFRQGLPGVVVRPIGIYGPGDGRFLKLFRAIERGRFIMIGSGRTLYHMTYIDDLVQGFILAGTRDNVLGEIFTIAGPRYTTIRELVDTVADVLGKPRPKLKVPFTPVFVASVICDKVCRSVGINPPLYPRRVEFFQLDRAFSIDKARSMLGYQPRFDLVEGLKRTAESYRAEGLI